MLPSARIATRLAILSLAAFGSRGAAAGESQCQRVLSGLGKLAVVTTASANDTQGRIRLYARGEPQGAWKPLSAGEPAVVGRNGLAWGFPFRDTAHDGEPVKEEGDGRTPAGFYRIGHSFGFAAGRQAGYLTLRAGRTICVDDPGSPAYNTLVSVRPGASKPRGEDMGAEPLYRRGLVIDYPSDAAKRAGSCIFLHVWRGPGQGTAGCIALPERRVANLQDFFAKGGAIAILPATARDRFSDCLPGE